VFFSPKIYNFFFKKTVFFFPKKKTISGQGPDQKIIRRLRFFSYHLSAEKITTSAHNRPVVGPSQPADYGHDRENIAGLPNLGFFPLFFLSEKSELC
jgi:hypothetical protein